MHLIGFILTFNSIDAAYIHRERQGDKGDIYYYMSA